ncbi:hypothetical protein [Gramella sp. MAR_2010_147]|uniref:hypothetical protein n=1 Tax=Gramella sp. MAR_2010_147 TaxID=1250205 RepID=UPI00087B6E2C|nr:hypothetical protein [Gramella sp. MAR_2010_147]SDR70077.1 hypothetical protein SAMN04488553_0348 [Gramella sp. MAR_2010_147]
MKIEFYLNILEVLFLVPFIYEINQKILNKLEREYSFFSKKKMNILFYYHLIFGGIYYVYAFSNPSDSKGYFSRAEDFQGSWLELLGTGTTFIDFISYPFINYLGCTYEMMMLLFTWVGYWGFVLGFLFFKENIKEGVRVFKKVDLLTLILFFPNMHFWSASIGKGALIFFGLMLFAYSFSRPRDRKLGLIISSLIVFVIRPHMFLLLCMGGGYGLYFGKNLIPKRVKIFGGIAILVGLVLLQDKILAVVNLGDSNDLISDFLKFSSNRSESLSSATSGVNMAGYSFPEKIFTFWFRPLFLDAPGFLGIIVSIENFIYLCLFGKIFRLNFIKFWKKAPSQVKSCFMIFVLTSFAMTFIMSNLGIMIRQKTMIMYFMFFVIYYFLAFEKSNEVKLRLERLSITSSAKSIKI